MDIVYSSARNSFIQPHSRIYVAGHQGMVGSALVRALRARGYANLIVRTRRELDLENQAAVNRFMASAEPDYIFFAAARVGGILANNTYRGEFIYQNLVVQTNLLHAAMRAGVKRLMFLGSSCIYPRDCPQPIKEEYLLTGPLERTNEPYAMAKIAGVKMCEAYNAQYGTSYISVMPTNLYGQNDHYDLETAHVLPALLRKAHFARVEGADRLEVWGSGNPRREFLHVEDMAEACMQLMEQGIGDGVYNIGSGTDVTIRELAETIARVVKFEGHLVFDASKPDGTPRKLLDVSRMRALGWRPRFDLEEGIRRTYDWCIKNEVFDYAEAAHG